MVRKSNNDFREDNEPEVEEIVIRDFDILEHYYVDKVDKNTGETYKKFECPMAVLLGRRRSGKSVKLISLLSECRDMFGTAYLFSPTAFGTGVFGTIFKHAFCYRQPDVETIKGIQALQDFLMDNKPSFLSHKDLICLIVLDDCGSLSFMKNKFLEELACNCRNSNIALWFTLQNFNQVQPVVRENCIRAGALITMANGTSTPIERVRKGQRVMARGRNGGLVARSVAAVLDKGMQQCVELLFEDGRTIQCTPNHRILGVTTDAEGHTRQSWVEAQHLEVGKSEVAVGVEFSSSSLSEEDDDNRWTLPTKSSLGYDLNTRERLAHAQALARIMGYALTDGTVGESTVVCFLGHKLDVETFRDDVELLTGKRPEAAENDKRIWSVALPAELAITCIAHGLNSGRSVEHVTELPAWLCDPTCPAAIAREFVGGLFGGGDGKTLSLSGGRRIEGIEWACTRKGKVVREQMTVFDQQLLGLLRHCGLDTTGITSSIREMGVQTKNNPDEELVADGFYVLSYGLSASLSEPFAQHIGFRYCCHKQVRLSAAVAYFRATRVIMSQRCRISDYVRRELARQTRLPMHQLVADGKADLARTELLHPETLRWMPADSSALCDQKSQYSAGSRGGLSVQRLLTRMDTLKLFKREDADTLELPTWKVRLVGRHDVGEQHVWDLSVPIDPKENEGYAGEQLLSGEHHSFVVAGIAGHNCDIFLTNLTSNISIQKKMYTEFFSCFGTLDCFVAALEHCAQKFGSMVWRNAGEYDDVEHSVFRYRCTNTNANSFSLDVPLQGMVQSLFGKTEDEKTADKLKEMDSLCDKISKMSNAEAEVDEDMELDPDEDDLVGLKGEDDPDYVGPGGEKADEDGAPKKKKPKPGVTAKNKPKKLIKSQIIKDKGGKGGGKRFLTAPIH